MLDIHRAFTRQTYVCEAWAQFPNIVWPTSKAVIGFVNWLCPTGIRANAQKCQEATISSLAAECPQGALICLLPTFVNKS